MSIALITGGLPSFMVSYLTIIRCPTQKWWAWGKLTRACLLLLISLTNREFRLLTSITALISVGPGGGAGSGGLDGLALFRIEIAEI